MSLYDTLPSEVDAMLAEFGAPVTLRKNGNSGTYNAATQQVVGATPEADYICNGVVIPSDESFIDGKHFEWNNEFHGGTNIEIGDSVFWVSAFQTNGAALPKAALGDKLISADGEEYFVTKVRSLRPATTTVAYELTVRK